MSDDLIEVLKELRKANQLLFLIYKEVSKK